MEQIQLIPDPSVISAVSRELQVDAEQNKTSWI